MGMSRSSSTSARPRVLMSTAAAFRVRCACNCTRSAAIGLCLNAGFGPTSYSKLRACTSRWCCVAARLGGALEHRLDRPAGGGRAQAQQHVDPQPHVVRHASGHQPCAGGAAARDRRTRHCLSAMIAWPRSPIRRRVVDHRGMHIAIRRSVSRCTSTQDPRARGTRVSAFAWGSNIRQLMWRWWRLCRSMRKSRAGMRPCN
jgi:hypothetical protein